MSSEENDKKMKKKKKSAELAAACIKNISFHKAIYNLGNDWRNQNTEDFWQVCSNNFLDMAVLEWCKLFADNSRAGPDSGHAWNFVLDNKEEFKKLLCMKLDIKSKEFEEYKEIVKKYRDKNVAHQDYYNDILIPDLEIMKNSVAFFSSYLGAEIYFLKESIDFSDQDNFDRLVINNYQYVHKKYDEYYEMACGAFRDHYYGFDVR